MIVTVADKPNTAIPIQTREIQALRMGIVSGRAIIPFLPGSTGFYRVLRGSTRFVRGARRFVGALPPPLKLRRDLAVAPSARRRAGRVARSPCSRAPWYHRRLDETASSP